jgi:CBS domain-containing protein
MPHRSLREIVSSQELLHVPPETTVLDAAKRMAERHVAAVLVVADGGLRGVFTERDLLRRVVVAGKDPAGVAIGDVMSPNPVSVDAGIPGYEALRVMREEGIRHIVVNGVGAEGFAILSMRDFFSGEIAEAVQEMDFQDRVWEEI